MDVCEQDIYACLDSLVREHNDMAHKTDGEKLHFKKEMDEYKHLIHSYIQGKERGTQEFKWDHISTSDIHQFILPFSVCHNRDPTVLHKLAVVKLNGGLGTTLGCKGPKSLIPIKNGETFLDICVRQIQDINRAHNISVPFVLMNSFYTDKDTENVITQHFGSTDIQFVNFNQSKYPRLRKGDLKPVVTSMSTQEHNKGLWYPP